MSKDSITVFCYPRSGSTWLCQMLADYLDCAFTGLGNKRPLGAEGEKRTAPWVVYQTHKLTPTDNRSVLITRDPRDISVSANHYWQIGSIYKTIQKMGRGEWPLTHGGGWAKFMDQAAAMSFDYTLDYFDLIKDTLGTLKTLCEYVALPLDQERLAAVVERNTFAARVAKVAQHGDQMPYGSEVQKRHLRKGVSGDWRKHYKAEFANLAAYYWDDYLIRYGYEMGLDWWRDVETA